MRSASRSLAWILFSVFALVAISFFFIPAFIIRPFTHQSPEGLHVAMALRQRAPVVTLTAALLALLMGIALWFAVGRWRKAVLVVVMLVVAFSTVMSRVNYFEWMFHPVDGARFEAASATKLDKDEMILAVRYANDARAYPISEMAYHHVLNDTVAGVPIAVTY
jgi:hypothetical protein